MASPWAWSSRLGSLRQELQAVRRALQDGKAYLGLSSEGSSAQSDLKKYLDQLEEKEKLIAELAKLSVPSLSNGADAAKGQMVARPAPPGPAATFDRCSLPDVITHMSAYEAVPQEVTKALRALASFAYKDAADVGHNTEAMEHLLRLMRLHASEGAVLQAALKCMCHLAYNEEVALSALSKPQVIATLVGVRTAGGCEDGVLTGTDATSSSRSAETSKQAGEALARLVAAEAAAEGNGRKALGDSVVTAIFKAEALAEARSFRAATDTTQAGLKELLVRLLEGELLDATFLAQRFVAAAPVAESSLAPSTAEASAGWLALLRQLLGSGTRCSALSEALVSGGTAQAATSLMEMQPRNAQVQAQGVAALLLMPEVCRRSGPEAVSKANGVRCTEAAFGNIPGEEALQVACIKLLVSVLDWPVAIQKSVAMDYARAISLTKEAMQHHVDSAVLQASALSALAKFIEVLAARDEVKAGGAEGLIKTVMTRHLNQSQVQTWGRIVLDGIGVDRSWVPRASAGNA